MAVYSNVVINVQGLSGSASFLVPRDRVLVVRDISAYNSAGGFATSILAKDGLTGAAFWFASHNPFEKGSVQWQGRQVFDAGSTIEVDTSAGPWDVRVSGYVLTQ